MWNSSIFFCDGVNKSVELVTTKYLLLEVDNIYYLPACAAKCSGVFPSLSGRFAFDPGSWTIASSRSTGPFEAT